MHVSRKWCIYGGGGGSRTRKNVLGLFRTFFLGFLQKNNHFDIFYLTAVPTVVIYI